MLSLGFNDWRCVKLDLRADFCSSADVVSVIDTCCVLSGNVLTMIAQSHDCFCYALWHYVVMDIKDVLLAPIFNEVVFFCCQATKKKIGKSYRAHRAYTCNEGCFFLFVDVTKHFVAR